MQPQPLIEDGARELHLLDYWRTIWRGRWTVLGIFVVVVTLVAIGTFTQKPIYRAAATVEISPASQKVTPMADVAELGAGSFGWLAEERYFNTQYEIIKSRDVAQRVFDRLDLYNSPEFKKSTDPIGAFASMVQVQPVKDTGIVEVAVEGPNPEEVALWVNTIAEVYVDRNLDMAVQATGTAVKSLLDEISPLREKLEESQRSSFEFAEKANLYVPENQQKITNDRLSTLQTDLTDTQVKRNEIENVLKEVASQGANGGSLESIPQVAADGGIQSLLVTRSQLEREYQRLLLTYREKHVRVLEKQAEIEKLNQRIRTEVDRVVGTLKTQLALYRDREAGLTRSLQETRLESLRVNQKASNFELMRGETTETRRIYDMISSRIKEIDLSASLLNNNLRVLDRAIVPTRAVKPRQVLNMAVGLLLGLLLGVGAVFFLDYLDNTVRSADDIERFLKLNLLAIVPRESPDTDGAVREAYQTLRTGLLFSRKSKGQNVVLFTSTGPQEGKSCTTINLARTIAAAGERVVVLDCDLRRPTVHQRLSLDREHGVTNYILSSDGDSWTTYAKPVSDRPGLFAITCGPIPPNPAEVFAHERFKQLLSELRSQFDWVFIDSPPVVSLADAVILASMADMVTFVIKHNETDKDLIRRCLLNLRRVNPNIIGAVLNNIDLDRSHYKDYYYVGYYYYGEGTGKKGGRRTSKTSRSVKPAAQTSLNRSVG
ncbi:MAG TPA: polysaccharide biosynthesis tyrosine autokinase [Candidatus Polarisedimenticolia bacterium]|nr:polysaccharide biosynthesis tyrosine autokinase [Candidatus Polarisedimenticolia bacterium]